MNLKHTIKRIIPKFILDNPLRKQIINFKILAIDYGQFKTIKEGVCIDKLDNPIPWFTYPAIEYLNNLEMEDLTVFEYGSGFSTLYWSKRCKKVVSVEHDEKWYNWLLERICEVPNISYHLAQREEEYIQKLDEFHEPFDIYVIDGRHRARCARKVVEFIRKCGGGMVIFDNSDWYPKTIEFLRNGLDWIEVDFCGFGPVAAGFTTITSFFINREFRLRNTCLKTIKGIVQYREDDF